MAGIKIQSALIMSDRGTAEVVHDLTIPSPEYNQVLVKVSHVALNTPDVLALDYLGRPGAGLGFDFSGQVVEIGEGVRNHWNVHDRVAGFVHACKHVHA